MLNVEGIVVQSYQDSSIFENLDGGIYTIGVRDKRGCGVVQHDVSVISYPNFITPNNDGFNDVWEIKGFSRTFYPVSEIYIYNRFGKVMAKLPAESPTWDGYYNGKPAPSNDYWFYVTLTDSNGNTRTKKGHFSLLRK